MYRSGIPFKHGCDRVWRVGPRQRAHRRCWRALFSEKQPEVNPPSNTSRHRNMLFRCPRRESPPRHANFFHSPLIYQEPHCHQRAGKSPTIGRRPRSRTRRDRSGSGSPRATMEVHPRREVPWRPPRVASETRASPLPSTSRRRAGA